MKFIGKIRHMLSNVLQNILQPIMRRISHPEPTEFILPVGSAFVDMSNPAFEDTANAYDGVQNTYATQLVGSQASSGSFRVTGGIAVPNVSWEPSNVQMIFYGNFAAYGNDDMQPASMLSGELLKADETMLAGYMNAVPGNWMNLGGPYTWTDLSGCQFTFSGFNSNWVYSGLPPEPAPPYYQHQFAGVWIKVSK